MTNVAVETVRPVRRRRRFRPTTTWLMGAIVVVAVWLGWVANSARTQRLAIEEILRPLVGFDGNRSGSGAYRYADHVAATFPVGSHPFNTGNSIFSGPRVSGKTSRIGGWLRKELGPDCFDEVAAVRLPAWDQAKLDAIGRLTGVRALELKNTSRYHRDELLAVVERMNRLEFLVAWMGEFTDAGLARLSNCPLLERLDLSYSKIDELGLRNLSNLTRLRVLNLSHCSVEGAGWRHLGDLTHVEWLFLAGSNLRREDMDVLARMTGLQHLYLQGTSFDDSGLVHLKKLRLLKSVDLRRTGVTREGAARLREAMPYVLVISS